MVDWKQYFPMHILVVYYASFLAYRETIQNLTSTDCKDSSYQKHIGSSI